MEQRRTGDIAIAAGVLAAAVAVWSWFRIFTGIRLEDALITFRYARNLAAGDGFVYNVGERVLGTTTPLLTLMLGIAGALAGSDAIPAAANLLMFAAAAAAAVLTGLALRAMGYPRSAALIAMAAVGFHPEMVWTTAGGMETPLVLMLMAAGLWAAARGAHLAAGAASALLILARIDGVVWAVGIGVLTAAAGRRAMLRAGAAVAAILAPWVIFSIAYFGSPVPHSVIAKRIVGGGDPVFDIERLRAFAAWALPFAGAAWPLIWPLGLALYAAGAMAAFRPGAPAGLRLAAVWTLAFPAALCVGGSPIHFDWYLTPVVWSAIVMAVAGAWAIGTRIGRAGPSPGAAAALFAAWLACAGVADWRSAVAQRSYQINEEGARRAVGDWLRRETPRDAAVAMEAIGYQGYYSDRRVIDLAGLVSPAVVDARRESATNARAFHRILEDLHPDYIVLRSFEVDRNLHYHGGPLFETSEQRMAFAGRYEEAARFTAPLPEIWGPTAHLTVYRRMEGKR